MRQCAKCFVRASLSIYTTVINDYGLSNLLKTRNLFLTVQETRKFKMKTKVTSVLD
jgi:hypothetical protein